jgi:hypothetical protein
MRISLKSLLKETTFTTNPTTDTLSYSDYNSPDVPNEVKPVYNLQENPDDIIIGKNPMGRDITIGAFDIKYVVSVFCLLQNLEKDYEKFLLYTKGRENKIFSDDKDVQKMLDDIVDRFDPDGAFTHGYLMGIARNKLNLIDAIHREDALLVGRIWKYKDIFYLSFWNDLTEIKYYKDDIKKLCGLLDISLEKTKFESVENEAYEASDWVNPEFIFGKTSLIRKPTRTADQIKDLLKRAHLDPEAKKKLNQITGLPPNKLDVLAKKLGYNSGAELQHILKTGMDENSI